MQASPSLSFSEKKITVAPGVFNGLSAKLAVRAGFKAIYASGGAIARSTGRPDIGLLSLTEVIARVTEIVDAAGDIPVIADADTGFGNEWNVQRTVHEFERAGVAAIHIEDQEFPKRCGHLGGKNLISPEAMCKKIRVAVKSRKSEAFKIIARTDAIAVEGFDAAIDRALKYGKAGADMLFVEAPETYKQIVEIAKQVPYPKLINMFYSGKTPLVPVDELKEMGYQLIIIPSDLQRASISAMQRVLEVIAEKGHSKELANSLVTFQGREEIVGTKDYLNLLLDE